MRSYVSKLRSCRKSRGCTATGKREKLMASSTRSHRDENLGQKVPAVIGVVSGDS